ncbi:ABC transporter substrate-binding protein [Microvirga puerhi]|uniref:sn-glycerol-3-phosphate-binding periplasmic protein UgpB n=1 Tax=Microvirga puerhi TaxID=2876078 RepID=A0ABS7VUN9_9HYPH|nr:sugar ABC transporter substrate-binding protein [Microvirga puerhi]MBZ6079309.1 sugar ABC transporter substrate-binding protein [Microvirga puerhi]
MTRTFDRRTILKTGLGVSAGLAVSGRVSRGLAQSPVKLTMAVWGGKAELDAYNQVITKYQAVHPNVSIRLDVLPSGQFYQQIDTKLAGRQAPDLFRATYQQVGRYAMSKAAVDLSQYIDPNYGAAFTPAVWSAVTYQGKPYALPHHTDTFALFYNADLLDKAGVAVPTSLDQAWTWDQFTKVARLLKEKSIGSYPFAMGWSANAVHRWMIFLYQHGGRLLSEDLKSPQGGSPALVETIAWTQSWFKDGLVPPSTSLKTAEPTQNLFANGTIPMMLNGNWQIPFVDQQAKFKWGVTYLPRDVAMADDMGGTCMAVSRDSKNPDIAADFLKFLVNEENMREYVSSAQFLPVRTSLVGSGLRFPLRSDEMKVFIEQTKTIPEHLVGTVIMPTWGKFASKLTDELDLAFTSGQSPEQTAKNIEAHVKGILLSA